MPNFRYDGFSEVVMHSQNTKMDGQEHRSSGNYLFTGEAFQSCSKVEWSCPTGVSFSVKRDHKAAKDDVVLTGVCNGSVTELPGGEGIYIADPSGTDSGNPKGKFEIRVKAAE
jgi:hypothetical protein